MRDLAVIWLSLTACLAVIGVAGVRLSRYGDIIAEKSGLSRGWVQPHQFPQLVDVPQAGRSPGRQRKTMRYEPPGHPKVAIPNGPIEQAPVPEGSPCPMRQKHFQHACLSVAGGKKDRRCMITGTSFLRGPQPLV